MLKSGNYVVGGINKSTGALKFSEYPAVHDSIDKAKAEAERLALKYTERKFVVVKLEATVSSSIFTWE